MPRINLSVDKERLAKIEELMERTGARNRAELFSYALTLYDWVTKEISHGRGLYTISEETAEKKELDMPPFRIAKEGGKREHCDE